MSERGLRAGLAVLAVAVALALVAAPLVSTPARASTGPHARGLSAAPRGTPALPAPTGPHSVGTTSLHLKDSSRPDPWVPSAKVRELMVTLWYPAAPGGRERAPYMTPKESELLLADGEITEVPGDILSRTRTNAHTDAGPAGRKGSLPLVVLSPGHSKPRSELTGLGEDLASRGYVVAAIGHTYENVAQTFPDGRLTTCVTCPMNKNPAWWGKLEKSRAADVSFVIDRLTGKRPAWKHAKLIDRTRIAMAGHSVGGASTLASMVADPRIRAGADIDGTVHSALPESGLARPFLFLGKPSSYTPGSGREEAASWEDAWKRMTAWKRWLLVNGTVHMSFTDLGTLADQLGLDYGAKIRGARVMEITRAHLAAFLDLHLRGRPGPVLDGPSPRYPEVRHCSGDTPVCT
ncbi:alpha/beta hydrolase [Bailinhaonella thermotolerans]|uniref:Alpha/beta hydrolase n=1 Tax=Bailinhaonella thermotolerans TaxID=1070861 RepID=A0A3A4AFX9_9ACTN|nr:alpha/beta hydrolase [Bailinhaonella thermotolerans]